MVNSDCKSQRQTLRVPRDADCRTHRPSEYCTHSKRGVCLICPFIGRICHRIKKTLPEALWTLLPLDPTPVCPYLDGAAGIPASLQRIAGQIAVRSGQPSYTFFRPMFVHKLINDVLSTVPPKNLLSCPLQQRAFCLNACVVCSYR